MSALNSAPTPASRPRGDVRDRLIEATTRCVAKVGLEGTTISAVAREAKVSRQTVYKYFATKEELASEGVRRAIEDSEERILARANAARTATGFALELFFAIQDEIALNSIVAPMIQLLNGADARNRVLSPELSAFSRRFLEPILAYLPEREPDLDEMTETMVRFHVSVVTLKSERTRTRDALRAYLMRSLIPALGLPPED